MGIHNKIRRDKEGAKLPFVDTIDENQSNNNISLDLEIN